MPRIGTAPTRRRRAPRAACAGLITTGLILGACGGSDTSGGSTSADANGSADQAQLAPIKSYLLDHTADLSASTVELNRLAERYYALAKSVGFDYAELLETRRAEVADLVTMSQAAWRKANPQYESMEGIVAGVPELADHDVIIDAGAAAKDDPESAVPFSLTTPAGRTYKQPGNFFALTETALWGTEPAFTAKGVPADLDGDGKVAFGEALPDADFYVSATRDFAKQAKELDASAKEWTPTDSDVFTALVVMTPTMSEYFEAWKNSRAIAGDRATEKSFVGASRLGDITDILSSLNVVYAGVKPAVADVSVQQAEQTGASLKELEAFAARLRDQEAGGKRFTPEEAETLGKEAQARAEAIAGQVTQAAGKLGIELEA